MSMLHRRRKTIDEILAGSDSEGNAGNGEDIGLNGQSEDDSEIQRPVRGAMQKALRNRTWMPGYERPQPLTESIGSKATNSVAARPNKTGKKRKIPSKEKEKTADSTKQKPFESDDDENIPLAAKKILTPAPRVSSKSEVTPTASRKVLEKTRAPAAGKHAPTPIADNAQHGGNDSAPSGDSADEASGEDENGSLEESEPDAGDQDLHAFGNNAEAIRRALQSEVAQFVNKNKDGSSSSGTRLKSNSRSVDNLFEDDDDIEIIAKRPRYNDRDGVVTSTRSRSAECNSDGTTGSHTRNGPESDCGGKPAGGKVPKRVQAMLDERPQFRASIKTEGQDDEGLLGPPGHANTLTARHTKSRRSRNALQEDEHIWPEQARVVWNDRGGINKSEQSIVMQQFLNEVIKSFEVDFAFHKALYATKVERDKVQSLLALQAARDCGAHEIKNRLRRDKRFLAAVLHVGEHRLVIFRSKFKETAVPLTPMDYGLRVDAASCELTKELMAKSLFVYRGSLQDGTLDRTAPFDREIFTEILCDHFFLGEDSIAAENTDRFVSSLESAPNEKEIPAAMVAIACTAVFSCLDDWKVRTQNADNSKKTAKRGFKKPEFPASELEPEYSKIITGIIDNMKTKPKMYHRVMHKVYMNVMAMRGQPQHVSAEDTASMLLLVDE